MKIPSRRGLGSRWFPSPVSVRFLFLTRLVATEDASLLGKGLEWRRYTERKGIDKPPEHDSLHGHETAVDKWADDKNLKPVFTIVSGEGLVGMLEKEQTNTQRRKILDTLSRWELTTVGTHHGPILHPDLESV